MLLEELAFFLYRLTRWVNWVMLWVLRAFRRNVTQYFLVTADGTQLPLTAYNYAILQPPTLLVIYYSSSATKYRMVSPAPDPNKTATDVVAGLRSAYSTYDSPTYSFLGLSVEVGGHTYSVSPQEFMVAGSTLFTPVFNVWLCKNYLHVPPAAVTATFIDDIVRMVTVTSEVVLQRDKYVVKQI